jgi:hypothetical protein
MQWLLVLYGTRLMLSAARKQVAWAFLRDFLWRFRGHRLDGGPD